MSERSALADRRTALARTTEAIHGTDVPVPDDERPALETASGPPPSIEASVQRVRRKPHRTRLNVYAALGIALLVCLIALATANIGAVRLHWLVGSGRDSLVWIVITSATLGALLGIVSSAVVRRKTRPAAATRRARRARSGQAP